MLGLGELEVVTLIVGDSVKSLDGSSDGRKGGAVIGDNEGEVVGNTEGNLVGVPVMG